MRRITRHISYANVMASLALLLSFGGTAYAAIIITGKNVKDSSLTGADVKNGSLAAADLDATAKTIFKGAKGDTGMTGFPGLTGQTGPKGDKGDPGAPAEVVTSYASRDTGFVTRVDDTNPNPSDLPWYDYNCANGSAAPCANDDGNQRTAGTGNVPLIASDTLTVALQGMPSRATNERMTSNNAITVPWNNNLTGIATVSLMHLAPANQETSIHERVECKLRYANSADPNTFNTLGEPQMVSAFANREIVNVPLVGSANLSAGTYNVKVTCNDQDYTSTSDHGWRFISANMTVMAARNG